MKFDPQDASIRAVVGDSAYCRAALVSIGEVDLELLTRRKDVPIGIIIQRETEAPLADIDEFSLELDGGFIPD